MLLFDYEVLPQCRWCTYCLEPFVADSTNFGYAKYGRWGLATTCRTCSNADRTLRKRYERAFPKPETCPICGSRGRMTIDHKHLDNDVSFLGWKCHPCNLRNQRKFKIGPIF